MKFGRMKKCNIVNVLDYSILLNFVSDDLLRSFTLLSLFICQRIKKYTSACVTEIIGGGYF